MGGFFTKYRSSIGVGTSTNADREHDFGEGRNPDLGLLYMAAMCMSNFRK